MNRWFYFLGGFVIGIVLTLLIGIIINKNASHDVINEESNDDGITLFDEPGDFIDIEAFKVFQVLNEDAALVCGESRKYSTIEVFTGAVYLLTNKDSKYYYDDEVVRVPENKVVRQIGIYQYQTKDFYKTVPIIQIMNK